MPLAQTAVPKAFPISWTKAFTKCSFTPSYLPSISLTDSLIWKRFFSRLCVFRPLILLPFIGLPHLIFNCNYLDFMMTLIFLIWVKLQLSEETFKFSRTVFILLFHHVRILMLFKYCKLYKHILQLYLLGF